MSDHTADEPGAVGASAVNERLKQLIQVGIALTSERELGTLLERIVAEARRFTNAEAATLYLRDGDHLRLAVADNAVLLERIGERQMRPRITAESLSLSQPTLAGHVALTGRPVCLPDTGGEPRNRPYAFSHDPALGLPEQTGSVLSVPLRGASRDAIGVLQLLNARNAAGDIVRFDADVESLVQTLAAQAAVAIRNARLEELSFKDPLTGVYNRRYFTLRLEEEARRYARVGEPISLVLFDVDCFKAINDALGDRVAADALKEAARLIVGHSRGFSIVTRYGGDQLAVLLVNTSKAGAIKYTQRIRDVVERHEFPRGPLTVSVGIAALPDDVLMWEDLVPAADRNLYLAKSLGRNAIEID